MSLTPLKCVGRVIQTAIQVDDSSEKDISKFLSLTQIFGHLHRLNIAPKQSAKAVSSNLQKSSLGMAYFQLLPECLLRKVRTLRSESTTNLLNS